VLGKYIVSLWKLKLFKNKKIVLLNQTIYSSYYNKENEGLRCSLDWMYADHAWSNSLSSQALNNSEMPVKQNGTTRAPCR